MKGEGKMHIDKTQPSYYLPPIKIEEREEKFSVTRMQKPDVFVVHGGKKLRYLDLERFDPKILKN